ncbi:MAG: carbohydrate kinase family protein, partial [Patescibacteria group bacterium]
VGLAEFGPQMVIITDGKNGSYGYDGEKLYKLEAFPANLAQTTGAGDGYATGVLAGLFYGKDLPEAMRWGAANGAAVVEKIGAQAGLLTHNQIMERLKENSKITAKEVY